MTALLGLSLGACSFSYSSGSSPSNSPNRSAGKPVHSSSSSGRQIDPRGKPISRSGSNDDDNGSGKPITKGGSEPDNDPPTRTKPEDPPTRTQADDDDPPTRTKTPPRRTKPASRPSEVEDTDEAMEADKPASNDTIRARTKTVDPSGSDTLVAPR